MANDFGKFCRKLRIDSDELLKNMADKLNVTSAYLSAVENGKRRIPDDWSEKLSQLYKLNDAQIAEMNEAIDSSLKEITINLAQSKNNAAKSTAIAFARKFDSLSDDEITKIQNILSKKK